MWEICTDSSHAGREEGETAIVFKMCESPAKCRRLGRSAFTYQKTLFHTLLLLVFKIVESLQYILRKVDFFY